MMNRTRALFLAMASFVAFDGAGVGLAQSVPNPVYNKPLDGPELSGPISATKTRTDNGIDTFQNRKSLAKSNKLPDAAYGAFQRGYYLTALELALPRAETGDPAAQTLIAEIYSKGLGVAVDQKKAITWYSFAAKGGNREAQFTYGNLLLQGTGVKQDKTEGQSFLEKAAKAGHSRAAFNLAQLITSNRPTYAGYRKALPWYLAAAEAGLTDAQYAMANIYAEARGVPTNDEKQARTWLAKAAEGGLDTAQVDYAIWLANGRGGAKNEGAAFYWLKRAVAQFNVIAQNRLARSYAFGIGTEIDMIKAGGWHIVARRAGISDTEMDRLFQSLPEIDRKRALEFANRFKKG